MAEITEAWRGGSDQMIRFAYITAHAPYGRGETFVLEEMLMAKKLGVELIIVPRNPPEEVFHKSAEELLDSTLHLPLLSGGIFFRFCGDLLVSRRLWKILKRIVRESRNTTILLKNLAVLPKAVYLSHVLLRLQVEHIHAHWGSTTSTMALVISELTGIPWSLTLHRWDIAENNLLRWKAERATFVRCISEDGCREALEIVGTEYRNKFRVLHMGVHIPKANAKKVTGNPSPFTVATPANLVPKKGHRYLIEALSILINEGLRNLRWLIIGDGPLEPEIRRQIANAGIEPYVKFLGRVPHEVLMGMYEKGEVDTVVLPSITTKDNEREGIPVSLMEAMAYGIPVVATATGGIPELLSDGCGILVPEKDPMQLAQAIRILVSDQKVAYEIAERGRRRIVAEYNLQRNVESLLEWIAQSLREKK